MAVNKSGDPLPKANIVTPATLSEIHNVFEITARTGQKLEERTNRQFNDPTPSKKNLQLIGGRREHGETRQQPNHQQCERRPERHRVPLANAAVKEVGVIEVVDILAAGFGPADERAPLRDRLGVDVAAVALSSET